MKYRFIFLIPFFIYSNFSQSQNQQFGELEYEIGNLIQLFEIEEFEKASSKIDELLIKFPESSTLYTMKGDAIMHFNTRFTSDTTLYNQVISYYNKAIDLDKNYYNAYYSRAHVYLAFQNFHEALNDISNALICSVSIEEKYGALSVRSLLFTYLQEYDKAIKDYKDMLKIEPKSDIAYSNLSILYMKKKEYQKAEILCLSAIEINPNELGYRNNLGLLYNKQEKYKEAEEIYNEFMPNDMHELAPYMLNNRGLARFKLGKVKLAQEDIIKSLKLYPDNAFAYRNMALIELELNQTQNACNFLETAIKLNFTAIYGDEVEQLIKANCKS